MMLHCLLSRAVFKHQRKALAEEEERTFAVAISEKQQEKMRFHIGDEISGTAWTKKYPKLEYAD